jgi:hypothetical protein
MKAARLVCLVIGSIYIFQSNPQLIQANSLGFIGGYLLGKGFDYVWDRITGKPDVLELERRIKELEDTVAQKNQNLADPIRKLRNSVHPDTSKEDFQRMVQKADNDFMRLIADLERRAAITDREIINLKERMAKLEAYPKLDSAKLPPAIPPQPRSEGPNFAPPRLNDRTIDACIKSYLFPEFQGRQCIEAAQRVITDEFCKSQGYSIGVSWKSEDTRKFQRSYKLFYEKEPNGTVTPRWIQDDTGGAIFTFIKCT